MDWQAKYRELRNAFLLLRNENDQFRKLLHDAGSMCESCPYHELARRWADLESGNKRRAERVNKLVKRRWKIYRDNRLELSQDLKHEHSR